MKHSVPWIYAWLGKILRLWVRLRTSPDSATQLGSLSEPVPPLVYCLQVRQLSDLLVLEEATQRLGLPSPFGAGPTDSRRHFYLSRTGQPSPLQLRPYEYSRRLVRLVQAIAQDKTGPVRIVPVSVFWGRAPDKPEGLIKALFSEGWGTPGAIRQLIRSVLHGRQTLLRFGEPMLLDATNLDSEAPERRVARLLRAEFRREREQAIGPNLSHRQTLVNQLIASEPVKQAIAEEAATRPLPLNKAEIKARAMAVEIASDYSYPFIRFFDGLLTALWNRIYDGVALHRIDTLNAISNGATVVYLPCHRSHIDYLLLSYIIYYQGLPVPHVAAGVNLNLPVVGSLLRKGGAFFMRRSFKGDKLYSAVFEQYMHMMMTRGFPLEYFIEGGRSRTGRTLAPKAGLLAITVESFMADSTRPVVFVPVYIGYERVLEGATYIDELSGKPKQRESVLGLIRALRSLKENFGKVHVNIGEPIRLDSFLDQHQPDWRTTRGRVERETIRLLSLEAIARINDALVLNPINLLALGLTGSTRNVLDARQLEQRIDLIRTLMQKVPYSAQQIVTSMAGREVLEYCVEQKIVSLRTHPLGNLIEIAAQQSIILSYFRNNVLHGLALPALLAALVDRNERIEPRKILLTARSVFAFLKREYFLSLDEAGMEARMQELLDCFIELGLLKTSGAWLLPPALHEAQAIALHGLALLLREPLERIAIVTGTLVRLGNAPLSRQQLEDTSHQLAQRVALLHETSGPQFHDRSAISAIVDTLIATGLARESPEGLQFEAAASTLSDQIAMLLPYETRVTISHLAQPLEIPPPPSPA